MSVPYTPVRVDPETLAIVKQIAQIEDRSVCTVVRRALKFYLLEYADLEVRHLAAAVGETELKRYERRKTNGFSAAENGSGKHEVRP